MLLNYCNSAIFNIAGRITRIGTDKLTKLSETLPAASLHDFHTTWWRQKLIHPHSCSSTTPPSYIKAREKQKVCCPPKSHNPLSMVLHMFVITLSEGSVFFNQGIVKSKLHTSHFHSILHHNVEFQFVQQSLVWSEFQKCPIVSLSSDINLMFICKILKYLHMLIFKSFKRTICNNTKRIL